MNKYLSVLIISLFYLFSSGGILISQSYASAKHQEDHKGHKDHDAKEGKNEHGHEEHSAEEGHDEKKGKDKHDHEEHSVEEGHDEKEEEDKHGHEKHDDEEGEEHEEGHGGHEEVSTEISPASAKVAGIFVEQVGAHRVYESIALTGKIILNQDKTYDIRARFPGIIRSVKVKWGQQVKRGQVLATIESNDSLKLYSLKSPRKGIVLKRNTNIGNVTTDSPLFTIANLSSVWAEFHVFPRDIHKIKVGQNVVVKTLENGVKDKAKITLMLPTADSDSQTIIVIAAMPNLKSKWRPGMTVEGKVQIAKKMAPIAISKSAIQTMENETVVFIRKGNVYEARHITIGAGDGKYVEVLEGLNKGEEYVSEGSFIVKADILKATASHSH